MSQQAWLPLNFFILKHLVLVSYDAHIHQEQPEHTAFNLCISFTGSLISFLFLQLYEVIVFLNS
jgi:hypothetical protein